MDVAFASGHGVNDVLDQETLQGLEALGGADAFGLGVNIKAMANEEGGDVDDEDGPVGNADDAQDYEDVELSDSDLQDDGGDGSADDSDADHDAAASAEEDEELKLPDEIPVATLGDTDEGPVLWFSKLNPVPTFPQPPTLTEAAAAAQRAERLRSSGGTATPSRHGKFVDEVAFLEGSDIPEGCRRAVRPVKTGATKGPWQARILTKAATDSGKATRKHTETSSSVTASIVQPTPVPAIATEAALCEWEKAVVISDPSRQSNAGDAPEFEEDLQNSNVQRQTGQRVGKGKQSNNAPARAGTQQRDAVWYELERCIRRNAQPLRSILAQDLEPHFGGPWVPNKVPPDDLHQLRISDVSLPKQGRDGVVNELLNRPLNHDLLEDSWFDGVAISTAPRTTSAGRLDWTKTQMNLNDAGQFFEPALAKKGALGAAVKDYKDALDRAAAMMLPVPPKIPSVKGPTHNEGPAALEMALLNVSHDEAYGDQSRKRKVEKGQATSKHSVLALTLATLSTRLTTEELRHFHRPKPLWAPPAIKSLPTPDLWGPFGPGPLQSGDPGAPMQLHGAGEGLAPDQDGAVQPDIIKDFILRTLPALGAGEEWKDVSATYTLQYLLEVAYKDSKKFKGYKDIPEGKQIPLFLGPGPRQLTPDAPLNQTGLRLSLPSVAVYLHWPHVSLLPEEKLLTSDQLQPNEKRPPTAFTKVHTLSGVSEGQMVLLEYLEEHPLLLSQTGMGVKLTTFYRKTSPTDDKHHQLQDENHIWKTGEIHALSPDDDSPFMGNIAAGAHVLSTDSTMFRAASAPFDVQGSDFLLVRSPLGALRLRQFNGTILVGQQEPMIRVPPPGNSKDMKEFEENQMKVWVYRELRKCQQKIDKKASKKGGPVQPPYVEAKAITKAFRNVAPSVTKTRLLACECQLKDDKWVLKEGARIPSEQELRAKVQPDAVCAAERSMATAERLVQLGVRNADHFKGKNTELIKLAISMLPVDEDSRKAAVVWFRAIRSTPWLLTDTYVTAVKEQKANMQITTGTGDPLGGGRGYSYLPIERKVVLNSGASNKHVITGTQADLRKLNMTEAKKLLLTFGMDEATVDGMSRWQRIHAIRSCSTTVAATGGGGDMDVYARQTRHNPAQVMTDISAKAQPVFERQLQSLLEDDPDEEPAQGMPTDESEILAPAIEESKKRAELEAKEQQGGTQQLQTTQATAAEDDDEHEMLMELLESYQQPKPSSSAVQPQASVAAGGDFTGTASALAATGQAEIAEGGLAGAPTVPAGPGAAVTEGTFPDAGDAAQWAYGAQQSEPPPFVYTGPDTMQLINESALQKPSAREGAKEGDRRVRRIILYTQPDGQRTYRELIFSDREKQTLLHSLYGETFPQPGFGLRVVREKGIADKPAGPPRGPPRQRKPKSARDAPVVAAPEESEMITLEDTSEDDMMAETDALAAEGEAVRPRAARARPADDDPMDEDFFSEEEEEYADDHSPDRDRSLKRKKSIPASGKGRGFRPGGRGGALKTTPAKKSTAPVSALKQFNRILGDVLTNVKKLIPEAHKWFENDVNRKAATDYDDYIAPGDVMYIRKIKGALRMNRYTTITRFQADVKKILTNAEVYNQPGKGKAGWPEIIRYANQLCSCITSQVQHHIVELARLEEAIGLEERQAAAAATTALPDNWVQCNQCDKWRSISQAVVDATVRDDMPWFCHYNFERVGASCADMDDEEVRNMTALL